jgi:uncharacterized membrane protein YedE/YeeE
MAVPPMTRERSPMSGIPIATRSPAAVSAIDPGGPIFEGRHTAELVISFFAGFVFSAGLTLSGMTQPDKVIGFLDIKELFVGEFPGLWDPSLGIVMFGAVLISLIGFATTPYASIRPWFTERFTLPTRKMVDGRLIAGAIIFGIGWGLSGYCPGPALATLLTGQIDIAIFVLAMLPGMWLARKI